MAPAVIAINKDEQSLMSPIREDNYEVWEHQAESPNSNTRRRSRRQEMELQNLRSKYQEAKLRMDKMKKGSESNRKMVLELSGVVKALQMISVAYDKDSGGPSGALENVQRKIRAIDDQMKTATLTCGHLEKEKMLQNSTIKAQEGQIKSMEHQIAILQNRLDQPQSSVSQYSSSSNSTEETELSKTMQEQEHKIILMEGQLEKYANEKRCVVTQEIQTLKEVNAAKYDHINSLESKLQALRTAQTDHNLQVVLIKDQNSKDEPSAITLVTKKPTVVQFAIADHDRGLPLEVIAEADESQEANAKSSYASNKMKKPASIQITASDDECVEIVVSDGKKNHNSIQISASDDESVEIVVSNINVADVSVSSDESSSGSSSSSTNHPKSIYSSSPSASNEVASMSSAVSSDHTTGSTLSLHSGSFENESSKKLVAQLEQMRRKYDKLKLEYEKNATEQQPVADDANLEEDYKTATTRVQELEKENNALRLNHSQALASMAEVSAVTARAETFQRENESMKNMVQEQKQKVTLANTKYEKLRLSHSKTVETLKESREQQSQLLQDYERVAHRESDIEGYEKLQNLHHVVVLKLADMGEENEKLQKIHEMVVLKLADMGEENEALQQERDNALVKISQLELRSTEKLSQLKLMNTEQLSHLELTSGEKNQATAAALEEAQQINRDTAADLETTKKNCARLEMKHQTVSEKVGKLCDQYETLKAKYIEAVNNKRVTNIENNEKYDDLRQDYESSLIQLKELSVAKQEAEEKLKQEHAEALAKVAVLEQSNQELETVKDKYNEAEAKVTILERGLEKAITRADSAQKKQEEREKHMRDLLFHYKNLEQEHNEANMQMERLLAVVSPACEISKSSSDLSDGNSTAHNSIATSDETKAAAYKAKIMACERRIKQLQSQRDAAMQQIKEIEKELKTAKQETAEAVESKKSREADLKIVLQHYKVLETKYEASLAKVDRLEAKAVKSKKEMERGETKKCDPVAATNASTDVNNIKEDLENKSQDGEVNPSDSHAELLNFGEESAVPASQQANDEIAESASAESQQVNDVKDKLPESASTESQQANDEKVEIPESATSESQQANDNNGKLSESTATQSQQVNDEKDELPKTESLANESIQDDSACTTEPSGQGADLIPADPSLDVAKTRQPENDDEEGYADEDLDSVAQLLIDMDELKHQMEDRVKENDRDVSTVSNVLDSMSLDSSSSSSSSSSSTSNTEASTMWKDKKIAQVLGELMEANDRVEALEEKHMGAKAKLDIMERKLLVAKREAEDATKRKEAREGNLRDVITTQKRLERDHQEVIEKISNLQEQLGYAKKEARIREEEAKAARKRLAGCHFHFKKLQDEHEEALKLIKKQEKELEDFKWDSSFADNTANMRKFRNKLMQEKFQLLKENGEMKAKLKKRPTKKKL